MKSTEHIIFLVGPMGSGKTTIGRLVASDLGMEFHDCDQDIEEQTGASVNLIFDVEGESGFRRRETQMLRQLSKRSGSLVATGGGVVTRSANRRILQSTGLVVWLKTSVEQQLKRLSHDKSRPLLQTADREARLRKLAGERDPLYGAVADLVFQSPNQNSRLAARKLSRLVRDYWQANGKGEIQHAGG